MNGPQEETTISNTVGILEKLVDELQGIVFNSPLVPETTVGKLQSNNSIMGFVNRISAANDTLNRCISGLNALK